MILTVYYLVLTSELQQNVVLVLPINTIVAK